jgi:hypothetical protein
VFLGAAFLSVLVVSFMLLRGAFGTCACFLERGGVEGALTEDMVVKERKACEWKSRERRRKREEVDLNCE